MVFIYRFHCTSTTTMCPLGGLHIQVPLTINYYIASLGRSLYTGSTVHRLLQCVPWVVFIIRVPLTINYYIASLGQSLYTGSTVHLLHCVPWVVFIYKFHCISTTVCIFIAFINLTKFTCTSKNDIIDHNTHIS